MCTSSWVCKHQHCSRRHSDDDVVVIAVCAIYRLRDSAADDDGHIPALIGRPRFVGPDCEDDVMSSTASSAAVEAS